MGIEMKKKIRIWYYHLIYEPLYSLKYSFKEIGRDLLDFLSDFKKPGTWSAILYVVCFYAVLKKNYNLFSWLIPLIALIYIIRQRVDGKYRIELFKKALRNNNELILKEEYKKYTRECYFTKQEPNIFETWKELELRKIDSMESSSQH